MAVLVSPTLTVIMVSADVKLHWETASELKSWVTVEVAVLIVVMVSADVKQN